MELFELKSQKEEDCMLGIIGAMDEEVAKIKEHMTDLEVHSKASMDFYKGFRNRSEKDVSVTGWKISRTGEFPVTVTGEHHSTYGNVNVVIRSVSEAAQS